MNNILIYINILSLILTSLIPSHVLAQGQSYSTYIARETKTYDEVIYKNNSYFRCETRKKCTKNETGEDDAGSSHHLIMLKADKGGEFIPTFLQCYPDGSGVVTLSENLIPLAKERMTKEDEIDCVNLNDIYDDESRELADKMLGVIDNYDHGCPKEDRSCAHQIADLFAKDLKNAFNVFSWGSSAEDQKSSTDMGCLSNVIANIIESIVSMIKLILWEIPKAGWRLVKNSWNYFFGEEEETTGAMVMASILPEDLSQAISDWDFPKVYATLKKNFFNLLGGIKTFYTELIGCTEWAGTPFESECLKKTNWSCPTCESMTNFICGLAGQLGAAFLLGGILGTVKGGLSLRKYSKQISENPKAFNLSKDLMEEMGAKKIIAGAKKAHDYSKYVKHRVAQSVRPISNVLRAGAQDIKNLTLLGDSFRKLSQKNPITLPYHLAYQAGKNQGFHIISNKQMTGKAGTYIAKKYEIHLANISDEFGKNVLAMKNITGDKFHPKIYQNLLDNYLTHVGEEMRRLGVKTELIKRGKGKQGIRLTKEGEYFDYVPNFEQKLKTSAYLDSDALKAILTHDDPILGGFNAYKAHPELGSGFLREMQKKANDARNIYTAKPDGIDGMVYLGNFTSQGDEVPTETNCERLLEDYSHFKSQEITN